MLEFRDGKTATPELFNAHTFVLALAALELIQVVNMSGMC
jgi:hypothetical protein